MLQRTQCAYQLTLAWLHVLNAQAYDECCRDGYGPHEPMEMWEQRLISERLPAYLLPLRPASVDDSPLTLNACDDMCPWFFAFGHTTYARWMPFFLKDMARLPETHPSVHEAFMEGTFVVQRGDKTFSLMGLDQSQEHSITFLKEENGAKGLYGQQEEKEVIELSKLKC